MKKSLGASPLIYPQPVLVVGTYDISGKANLMTAAWGGVCSGEPPCVSVAIRSSRHTYGAIMERGAFTVNILSVAQVEEADYYGIVSGKNVDKFASTDITPVRSDVVDAPYGEEFPLVLECSLKTTLELGSHVLVIGEIRDVKAEESILGERGYPLVELLQPIVFDFGMKNYHSVGPAVAKAFSVGTGFRKK